MIRKSNWPELLAEEILAADKRAFQYGDHDCCMFAARVVKLLSGKDVARGLRDYKSAAGAIRMLNNIDCADVVDLIIRQAHLIEAEEVNMARAKRGDLVVGRDENDEYTLGICLGYYSAFPGEIGLIYKETLKLERAWHYG